PRARDEVRAHAARGDDAPRVREPRFGGAEEAVRHRRAGFGRLESAPQRRDGARRPTTMDRRFGWMKDEVPVVGMGTWHMAKNRRQEAEALTIGLGLGLGHIDTAELYGEGTVEELVGEVLKAHVREDVFLVSKVLPDHATHKGTVAACDASLRRLGTDYLDVYLLHWPGDIPVGETMGALEDLVVAGKIR